MSLQSTLTVFEALDGATVDGQTIVDMFAPFSEFGVTVTVTTVNDEPPKTRRRRPTSCRS